MENLPDEILIEIFDYLGSNSLIKATETCERWSNLIKNTNQLMKKFTVRIRKKLTKIFEENPLPSAQHVNLLIERVPLDSPILSKYFQSIREIQIKSVNGTFMNLQNFENLEKISLNNCEIYLECDNWKNLNTLEIKNSPIEVLEKFNNSKLSKISIINAKFKDRENHDKIYKTLLNHTQNLTELRMINVNFNEEMMVEIIKQKRLKIVEFDLKYLGNNVSVIKEIVVGFQWKSLIFRGAPCYPDICRLIINNTKDLSKIEFKKAPFDFDLLSHIFTSHPNLKHLRLSGNYGPIPDSPPPLDNLETLEIEVLRYTADVLKLIKILQVAGNLKTLKNLWIGKHAMNNHNLEMILNAAPQIQNLQLDTNSIIPNTFKLTKEMIETVIEKAKNLKRFVAFTYDVEEVREKFGRILQDKGIQGVVRSKMNMESYSVEEFCQKIREISRCEWRR